MKRSVTRIAILGAFVSSSLPCSGQTTAQSELGKEFIPNQDMMVSAGGVDVLSGKYQPSSADLSIDSSFEFSRQAGLGVPGHVDPMGVLTHNFDIMITERMFDHKKANPNFGGNDYRLGVRFGPRTASFDSWELHAGFSPTGRGNLGQLAIAGNRESAGALYTYTARDGTTVTFRPIGGGDCSTFYRCAYASKIEYPTGETLDFSYLNAGGTANPKVLRSVVSNRGYAFVFEYAQLSGKNVIATACLVNLAVRAAPSTCQGVVEASASYTYTTIGGVPHMTSVTLPDGRGEVYGYSNGGLRQTYSYAGEAAPWQTIEFGLRKNVELIDERVVGSQSFANGESLTYASTPAPSFTPGVQPPRGDLTITNARGHDVKYTYDFPVNALAEKLSAQPEPGIPDGDFNSYRQVEPGPSQIKDSLGRITEYNYCDRLAAQYDVNGDGSSDCQVSDLQDFSLPTGLKTELYYVGPGKVGEYRQIDPSEQLADRSLFQQFSCAAKACELKPTKIVDSEGYGTDFVYSTQSGNLISKTSPPDKTGIRPQTRYSYAKNYAWTKIGSSYVKQPVGIWSLVREEYCRTSAATNVVVNTNSVTGDCAAGASDEVVTTYEYQTGSSTKGSNLLLLGTAVTADGQTLRTCYGYDKLGRKISETSPRADLASCQ